MLYIYIIQGESDFSFEEKENVFSSGRMASRDLPLSRHGQTNVRLV